MSLQRGAAGQPHRTKTTPRPNLSLQRGAAGQPGPTNHAPPHDCRCNAGRSSDDAGPAGDDGGGGGGGTTGEGGGGRTTVAEQSRRWLSQVGSRVVGMDTAELDYDWIIDPQILRGRSLRYLLVDILMTYRQATVAEMVTPAGRAWPHVERPSIQGHLRRPAMGDRPRPCRPGLQRRLPPRSGLSIDTPSGQVAGLQGRHLDAADGPQDSAAAIPPRPTPALPATALHQPQPVQRNVALSVWHLSSVVRPQLAMAL